jgi:hypothetical protein
MRNSDFCLSATEGQCGSEGAIAVSLFENPSVNSSDVLTPIACGPDMMPIQGGAALSDEGSADFGEKSLLPAIDQALQTGATLLSEASSAVNQTLTPLNQTVNKSVHKTLEATAEVAANLASGVTSSARDVLSAAAERWNAPENRTRHAINQQCEKMAKGVGELTSEVNNSDGIDKIRQYRQAVSERLSTLTDGIYGELGYANTRTGSSENPRSEDVLVQAELRLKENLIDLRNSSDFAEIFQTAFGDQANQAKASAAVNDFISGKATPNIEIVSSELLVGGAAFGNNTIFISDRYLSENAENTEAIDQVLLEEAGHYFDKALNAVDSEGDEGDIFAQLAQGKTLSEAELQTLKAEDDHSTLLYQNETIEVENFWDSISSTVSDTYDSFSSSVSDTYDSVVDTVSDTYDSFSSSVSDTYDSVSDTVSDTYDSFSSSVSDTYDSVSDTVSDTYDSFSSSVSDTYDSVVDTVSDTYDSFSSSVSDTYDSVSDTVSDTYDSFSNTVSDTYDSFSSSVSDTYDSVVDTVSDTYDSVSSTVSDTYDSFSSSVSDTYDSVADTVSDTYDSFSSSVADTYDSVVDTVSDTYNSVSETVSDTYDSVVDTVSDTYDGVVDTVSDTYDSVSNAISPDSNDDSLVQDLSQSALMGGVFQDLTYPVLQDLPGPEKGTTSRYNLSFRDISGHPKPTGYAYLNRVTPPANNWKGLRLDYGPNVKTNNATNWHWNQKGANATFGIADHSLASPTATNFGKTMQLARPLGRAAVGVGAVMDGISLAGEVNESLETGNWDNTAIEGSRIAGGWGGAALGAKGGGTLGAAIGTAIAPGLGTAIGGAVGGFAGGIAGYFGGSEIGESVSEWAFGEDEDEN